MKLEKAKPEEPKLLSWSKDTFGVWEISLLQNRKVQTFSICSQYKLDVFLRMYNRKAFSKALEYLKQNQMCENFTHLNKEGE